MRIAFSRDRAAQLDLLLRSAEWAGHPIDAVIACHTSEFYAAGYRQIGVTSVPAEKEDFKGSLLRMLVDTPDRTVSFFCDDDVFMRYVGDWPEKAMAANEDLICASLRLGEGNARRKPAGFPLWKWPRMHRTDFGFPGSIDGHCFRVIDVLSMIEGEEIPNPTMLETALARKVEDFARDRPLMTCLKKQALVGVPVNRVSPSSGVSNGQLHPQRPIDLNALLLNNWRIWHAGMFSDFDHVHSCHQEFAYPWERVE